jgi:hypothetical protein
MTELCVLLPHVSASGLEKISHVETFTELFESRMSGRMMCYGQKDLFVQNAVLPESCSAGGSVEQRSWPARTRQSSQRFLRGVLESVMKVTGRGPTKPIHRREPELGRPRRHQFGDPRRMGSTIRATGGPPGQRACSSGGFDEWMYLPRHVRSASPIK